MKTTILLIFNTFGTILTALLGVVDLALQLLFLVMVIDFITGLMVAAIFKKSKKTCDGNLSSNIGFKGICKKLMIISFIIIGTFLDMLLNINYARIIIITFFISNEFLSIVENAGLMGVPIPQKIKDMFEALGKEKENDQAIK